MPMRARDAYGRLQPFYRFGPIFDAKWAAMCAHDGAQAGREIWTAEEKQTRDNLMILFQRRGADWRLCANRH